MRQVSGANCSDAHMYVMYAYELDVVALIHLGAYIHRVLILYG